MAFADDAPPQHVEFPIELRLREALPPRTGIAQLVRQVERMVQIVRVTQLAIADQDDGLQEFRARFVLARRLSNAVSESSRDC